MLFVVVVTQVQISLISCWCVMPLLTQPNPISVYINDSEMWSTICGLNVYHRQKSIINCQHNFKAKFCIGKACTVVVRILETLTQVSCMNNQAFQAHPILWTILNMSVTWCGQLGMYPLMRWPTNCILVMILPMKSPMINLCFCKVYAWHVTKQLTEKDKCHHLKVYQQLLNQYCDHGDAFLRCVTTGNKTWIQHFQLESKHQSLKWKHQTSLVRMTVRTQATPRKQCLHFSGMHRGWQWNIM